MEGPAHRRQGRFFESNSQSYPQILWVTWQPCQGRVEGKQADLIVYFCNGKTVDLSVARRPFPPIGCALLPAVRRCQDFATYLLGKGRQVSAVKPRVAFQIDGV